VIWRTVQAILPLRAAEYHERSAVGQAKNLSIKPLYDANGNLTSGGARNFIYDPENRLIQLGRCSPPALVRCGVRR
jgi:hypothetical protein